MATGYQKSQIEDVARILWAQLRAAQLGKREQAITVLQWVVGNFADLFAADNPPWCFYCGQCKGVGVYCAFRGKHDFGNGFNRTEFLEACGIPNE